MKKTIFLSDITNEKLLDYCKKTHIKQSTVVSLALESFILNDVEINAMTILELESKYSEINRKIQQLEELKRKILEEL